MFRFRATAIFFSRDFRFGFPDGSSIHPYDLLRRRAVFRSASDIGWPMGAATATSKPRPMAVSPSAIAGGSLYLRSQEAMYCIRQ